jgi:secondary thiamine-phosphate synthase enzyme
MQSLRVTTSSQSEFVDITALVRQAVQESGAVSGVLHLYCPHTSCGLTIQENCDPGVQQDMLLVLNRLVPRADPAYRHNEDNSASHVQTSMMGVSQVLLVEDGAPILGRWQAIFLAEFDGPRERTVLLKLQPDRH